MKVSKKYLEFLFLEKFDAEKIYNRLREAPPGNQEDVPVENAKFDAAKSRVEFVNDALDKYILTHGEGR